MRWWPARFARATDATVMIHAGIPTLVQMCVAGAKVLALLVMDILALSEEQ